MDRHRSVEHVWYDGIYLGVISTKITEQQDIDWQKYRDDKSLGMSPAERYVVSYEARTHGAAGADTLRAMTDRMGAARAMLDHHRKNAPKKCKGDGDDV